ncbi:MAG: hypothetical protein R3E76_03025 [Planctomycetota bacterium]
MAGDQTAKRKRQRNRQKGQSWAITSSKRRQPADETQEESRSSAKS